jgi:hypothetical protein
MAKITPEEVVNSYITLQEYGVKPKQCVTYDRHSKCACGLAAIHFANNLSDLQSGIYIDVFHPIDQKYGFVYTEGFIKGFDGRTRYPEANEDWLEGYTDGLAAWKAIVEKGLVVR